MLDSRSTAREVREGRPEIAVFGTGATEQHSIHLPVGTDWLGISEMTHRVAAELGAFLVPALPFSMSECHGPMAGTVWLKPQTLAAVVRDTVLSLYAQGFRKVLLMNGHGGNFVLEAEIRRLNLTYPDLIVLMPGDAVRLISGPKILDKGGEVHAGEGETARQLFINRQIVKDKRVDYMPPVGREFLDYAFIGFISEWGVWGYPTYGTAEKGEKVTIQSVAQVAAWARETFARVETLRRLGKEG